MIDSHCHLNFNDFDKRRDDVVAEANRVGVHTIVNIGVDTNTSEQSVKLAEKYDCIYATVGYHPHDAKSFATADSERIRELAGHPKVRAIGEIGLDYYRDMSPREVQRRVFRQQLDLAVELDLPVVIHTRESFDEALAIVAEYAGRISGGVFHCFPGDIDDAFAVIEQGFLLGIGGIVTFDRSRMGRVVAEVPLESIVLETDAPYLAPVPFRGKTNSPAYIPCICKRVAELKQTGPDEVERITDRTCRKLFGLAETFGG